MPCAGVATGVVLLRDNDVIPRPRRSASPGQRLHLAEVLPSACSLILPVKGVDRRTTSAQHHSLEMAARWSTAQVTPRCGLGSEIVAARVRNGPTAAVARCGKRVSHAPESRPTASSINHLFRAIADVWARAAAPRLSTPWRRSLRDSCDPEIRRSQDSTRPLIPQRRFRRLERFSGDSSGRNPDMS